MMTPVSSDGTLWMFHSVWGEGEVNFLGQFVDGCMSVIRFDLIVRASAA